MKKILIILGLLFIGLSVSAQTIKKSPSNYNREILQQPQVIQNLLDKYFLKKCEISNLNLGLTNKDLSEIQNIKIVASGSSKNAAEVAKPFMEQTTGLPVTTYFASEFAHGTTPVDGKSLIIFISQSGETADTYAALIKANFDGAKTIALTNVPTSKIHKNAHAAVEVGAGKEQAVAATKSVTAQIINLYAISLKLAEAKGKISAEKVKLYTEELKTIPKNLDKMLQDKAPVEKACKLIGSEKDIFILARGVNYGSGLEGALKLRETIYANSVAFPSGEFIHGYIASVDEKTPVIQIIPGNKKDENYILALGNISKIIKDRNPKRVIIIKTEGNTEIEKIPAFKNVQFIDTPAIEESFSPVYAIARFQMLAEAITTARHLNPDKPRSLTKAVTSE